MVQQKEARRKHPCVLPKKVACLVWVPDSALIGNGGCFLRASFCTAATYYSILGLQYTHITTALLGNDGCYLRAS